MTAISPSVKLLNDAGQSIWYDNLSRDVLRSGELASLLKKGVSGLTSNPTIFKKAIADTDHYDTEIRELSKKGLSVDEICEELFVADVGAAADLLKPIYDASSGQDGCASIEVSPLLAYETQKTIDAGRRIWKKLNRPNIMIKVPATKEGLPAIKTLLSEGINVNVTLIFSVDRYKDVIKQYKDGLSSCTGPINNIASVASFFVSRVDSIIERKLADNKEVQSKYLGKVGIANSILAYDLFEKEFSSNEFGDLFAKGAKVQRPLWASTGTKNPSFSPVLYIEALALKSTVNTVPPATLEAIFKGAKLGTPPSVKESKGIIDSLASNGVSFDKALLELEDEGVKIFKDSYLELVSSIETKREKLV